MDAGGRVREYSSQVPKREFQVTRMNEPLPVPPSDERTWALVAHLSGLLGFVTAGFGSLLGPLIVWLIKREEMPFVADQGREALNFQITVFLAGLICAALMFLLIGFPMLFALILFDLVFVILAAVKASEGVAYRYPICLRLIR